MATPTTLIVLSALSGLFLWHLLRRAPRPDNPFGVIEGIAVIVALVAPVILFLVIFI